MRTFPQELVDKVIDELADTDGDGIAPYSLVSRAWVTRTQQHHFEWIDLDDLDELEKWRTRIAPNPAGVSRHTRQLVLTNIDTLEGFEAHIRAFTRIQDLEIAECDFLLSLSVVECFAPMGSSLAELKISESPTTSHVITSLLAALPQLKRFMVEDTKVIDDTCGANILTQVIPFFEGNNSLALESSWEQQDPPGPPDWIPSSARFGDLEIDMTYFLHKTVLVNRWFSNSCTTLTSLTIHGDPDSLLPGPFTPLDLSPCRALACLYVTVPHHRPGKIVETILPSITSSQLSYISLQLEATELGNYLEIDYSAWAAAEKHFCRLAKRFSAGNPGEKMVVSVSEEDEWYGPQAGHFRKVFDCKEFLPRLKEAATLSLPIYT